MFALIPASALAQSSSESAADGVVTRRALCIGFDVYPTEADSIDPVAQNSAQNMYNLFTKLGYANVVKAVNKQANSRAKLKNYIDETFAGADEDDVSYFTLNCHGVIRGGIHGFLIPKSDNVYFLDVNTFASLFDDVKGTVVLMIDACGSGGLIEKSSSYDAEEFANSVISAFGSEVQSRSSLTRPKFKVLCAASQDQLAFLKQLSDPNDYYCYFTSAIALGCGEHFSYKDIDYSEAPADANRDGAITLSELKSFIADENTGSLVRTYPEEDDFHIIEYGDRLTPPVITLSGANVDYKAGTVKVTISSSKKADVTLSLYTEKETSSSELQLKDILLFSTDDKIDSKNITHIISSSYTLKAGSKKTITIPLTAFPTGVYCIRAVSSVQKFNPTSYFSVTAEEVNPTLTLSGDDKYLPADGGEYSLQASVTANKNTSTASLSCIITDSEGKTLRTLAKNKTAQVVENNSTYSPTYSCYQKFYWDGKDNNGEQVPDGEYTFVVRADYKGDSLLKSKTVTLSFASAELPAITSARLSSSIVKYPAANKATFKLNIDRDAVMNVWVEDVNGNKVATLAKNDAREAGALEYDWDLTLSSGEVQLGIYYLKATASNDAGESEAASAQLRINTANAPQLQIVKCTMQQKAKHRVSITVNSDLLCAMTLRVYTLGGEEIYKGKDTSVNAGQHTFYWDGTRTDGLSVRSGIYILSISGTNDGENIGTASTGVIIHS